MVFILNTSSVLVVITITSVLLVANIETSEGMMDIIIPVVHRIAFLLALADGLATSAAGGHFRQHTHTAIFYVIYQRCTGKYNIHHQHGC